MTVIPDYPFPLSHNAILYIDNHLLVVDKPAGMLTQDNETGEDSLQELCRRWLVAAFNKPGDAFIAAIHRLDRPVSGVTVFARTSKALSRLNAAMRNNAIKKRYEAIVEGNVEVMEGSLEHFLFHGEHKATVVGEGNPRGKRAILLYRVERYLDDSTLLSIELITGRYHQIRAQLSAWGHPILGDGKYGSDRAFTEGAIALHSAAVTLPHPTKEVMLRFEAPFKRKTT